MTPERRRQPRIQSSTDTPTFRHHIPVGQVEVPHSGGSDKMLEDPNQLRLLHPLLKKKFDSLRVDGSKLWGYFDHNKAKFVITVVTAGAAAVGIVGVGTYIKKHSNKKNK